MKAFLNHLPQVEAYSRDALTIYKVIKSHINERILAVWRGRKETHVSVHVTFSKPMSLSDYWCLDPMITKALSKELGKNKHNKASLSKSIQYDWEKSVSKTIMHRISTFQPQWPFLLPWTSLTPLLTTGYYHMEFLCLPCSSHALPHNLVNN